jgi:phosphate transport system substrate-binding protein
MKTKKILATAAAGLIAMASLAGCGSTGSSSSTGGFDTKSNISVITREDGSGTRSAFIELTGVQEEKDGTKTDNTLSTAIVQSSTQAVLTGVAGDPTAIGYISLGSLNDTVKAAKIDGVEPTSETVKDGSYKISRPFNIATKDNLSEAAQNFIDYILSKEGQEIVNKDYVEAVDNAEPFAGAKGKGKVKVGGSTSVSPAMEKLAEAYQKVNKDVTVEVNTSDSSTGMSQAAEGTVDIGMASRELKDSETAKGIKGTVIAKDGIAVIVNKSNTVEDIKLDQLKGIYTGSITTWELG